MNPGTSGFAFSLAHHPLLICCCSLLLLLLLAASLIVQRNVPLYMINSEVYDMQNTLMM